MEGFGNLDKVGLKQKAPVRRPNRTRPRGDTVVPLYPKKKRHNKKAESSRNATLERLLDAFVDMVIICDKDMDSVLACNEKVEKGSGFDIEQLSTKPLSLFFSPSTLQTFQNGDTVLKNQEMECASGLKLPVDISIEELDWNGKEALMMKIKDLQDDREIRQVVAGVVHDLNNVFCILDGNLTFLKDNLDTQDSEEIQAISLATNRGIALVNQLQQLTTKEIHRPRNEQILRLIEEMISSLGYWQRKYNVSFEIDCPNDHICFIDTPKLTEAIFNLIKNAKDAMPEGGTIKIGIHKEKPGEQDANARKGIYLSIEDNGTGIPLEHRNKIFSPAFSTKRLEQKGYGFGLANVLRVVKAHQGSICVESQTGEDSFTRFVIFLPE